MYIIIEDNQVLLIYYKNSLRFHRNETCTFSISARQSCDPTGSVSLSLEFSHARAGRCAHLCASRKEETCEFLAQRQSVQFTARNPSVAANLVNALWLLERLLKKRLYLGIFSVVSLNLRVAMINWTSEFPAITFTNGTTENWIWLQKIRSMQVGRLGWF